MNIATWMGCYTDDKFYNNITDKCNVRKSLCYIKKD